MATTKITKGPTITTGDHEKKVNSVVERLAELRKAHAAWEAASRAACDADYKIDQLAHNVPAAGRDALRASESARVDFDGLCRAEAAARVALDAAAAALPGITIGEYSDDHGIPLLSLTPLLRSSPSIADRIVASAIVALTAEPAMSDQN